MQIYILMFHNRVERASVNAPKIYALARELNGEDNPFGSYNVILAELEDVSQPLKLADGIIRSEIPNANTDEQIAFLVEALEQLASDEYHPWHGEDAIDMRDEAREVLRVWKAKVKQHKE